MDKETEEKFMKYFKAKQTTLEMAIDRGFDIGTSSRFLNLKFDSFMEFYRKERRNVDFSYEFFNEKFQRDTVETSRKKNKEGKIVEETKDVTEVLYFKFAHKAEEGTSIGDRPLGRNKLKKFGKQDANNFLAELKDIKGDLRRGILIIEQDPSPKALIALTTDYLFKVQVFKVNDLQYNVTHHVFSPKYKILTSKEQSDLLRTNHISIKNLPLISVNDPISKYFGLSVGQVIRKTSSNFIGETMTDKVVEYSVVESVLLS